MIFHKLCGAISALFRSSFQGASHFELNKGVSWQIHHKSFGDDGGREPRVPIPNTNVKPSSVDGTWTAGSWESRTSPSEPIHMGLNFFFYGPLAQLVRAHP